MYTREEQSSIIHPGNNIVRIHIILKNTGCDFTCMSTGQTWTTSQMYSHKGDIIVNKKWKSKNWERSKLQPPNVFTILCIFCTGVWLRECLSKCSLPNSETQSSVQKWGMRIHPHRKLKTAGTRASRLVLDDSRKPHPVGHCLMCVGLSLHKPSLRTSCFLCQSSRITI